MGINIPSYYSYYIGIARSWKGEEADVEILRGRTEKVKCDR